MYIVVNNGIPFRSVPVRSVRPGILDFYFIFKNTPVEGAASSHAVRDI